MTTEYVPCPSSPLAVLISKVIGQQGQSLMSKNSVLSTEDSFAVGRRKKTWIRKQDLASYVVSPWASGPPELQTVSVCSGHSTSGAFVEGN